MEKMLSSTVGEWKHATYDIAITPDGETTEPFIS